MMMWRKGILLAACLAGALLVACGDEKIVNVSPKPAIQVTVQATPQSVDTGQPITVQAVASATNASPLSYQWTADGGSFTNASADSTVWTAPDNAGIYRLAVVVTDGKDVAIGSANVGVASYLPSVTPFYRGVTFCSTCHNGGPGGQQYATWSTSRHAGALNSLKSIGQGENPACVGCHTVGSYGLNADAALNNGGWDETHVDRLAGVQCENCHGPGSDHHDPDFASVGKTLDASLCGQCHNGIHHPTYDEWQSSAHAGIVEDAALNKSCAKCHNGLFAPDYLDNPEGFAALAANPTESLMLTCAGCHEPHGNANPGSLRDASVTDRALPNGVLVEKAGAGRLCMACHNGRRTNTDVNNQIANGNAHLGPHHSVQGDMITGVNAYQAINPSFFWASSKHILVQDACVTCHTHPHPGDPESGIANFMGHNFRPVVEACAPCHGTIASFRDVMAKQDYDGDGQVEGVQDEVDGLLEVLEQSIVAASTTQAAHDSLTANFEGRMGDATLTTVDQRKAAYNWAFVSFDGSHGVHNANYAVQLLQQSILFLDSTALPAEAYVLRRPD
jgi:hypothetical protein